MACEPQLYCSLKQDRDFQEIQITKKKQSENCGEGSYQFIIN